jgi:ABC-2 type transport system ATP-binding protein
MSPHVSRARIEEVVKRVGATAYVHQKVKTYSNAQRQRLALAQALLHQPSLLLIEPIGPDLDILHEYVDLLRELADEEGIAVIITSPLLSVMERVCDRVGIIHEGRLVSMRNFRDFRDPHQKQDGGEQIG